MVKEAEFQNRRVEAKHVGQAEPRDRYYYLTRRAAKHYQSHLEDITGKSIVVVGCSEGGVTPLARRGAHVLGIDISDAAITSLSQAIVKEGLGDHAAARVMDAENLDLPDGSIDIICCSGVLHHLDTEAAAQSWAKKITVSGCAVMLEPMALNPLIALYRKLTPAMRTADEHPLRPRDLRILRKYFGVVDVTGYVLTSLFTIPLTFFPNRWSIRERLLRLLEALDDWLLAKYPTLVYLCWTAVIVLSEPRKANTEID